MDEIQFSKYMDSMNFHELTAERDRLITDMANFETLRDHCSTDVAKYLCKKASLELNERCDRITDALKVYFSNLKAE